MTTIWKSLLLLALSIVGQGAFASPSEVLPLSPDAQGHPRLRFTDTGTSTSFYVARGIVGNVSCPIASETRNFDSANGLTWCARTLPSGEHGSYSLLKTGSLWTYTDRLIRLDDADTREFKYRVGTDSTTYSSVWTASCPIDDSRDPLDVWLESFNHRIGVSTSTPLNGDLLARTDIPAPNSVTPANPPSAAFLTNCLS
jgi:hypothetical protein